MESQEDRVKYVNDLLEEFRENATEQESEQVAPVEPQLQPHQMGLPEGLSTPVNVTPESKPKKKKKKKKSKTANLPEAGSELADDYEEKYKEDVIENPYDPERSLTQRIEYAIWKYKQNHKFTETRRAIFDNYLRFGCIETGPNAFMGQTPAFQPDPDLDSDEEDKAIKIKTDVVADDDDEGLEVNFTEVAQVYLGNTFIRESLFIGMQDFIDAPVLIDAFLRYLEIRKVFPEYADDIARARQIAAMAKVQLPMCKKAAGLFPGSFNTACAVLFGGSIKPAWMVEAASWMSATSKTQKLADQFMASTVGMSPEEAQALVNPVLQDYSKRTVVDERKELFVKIADTQEATDELVKVTLADYNNENETFQIFLERNIAEQLLVGMVLTASLCQLDSGHWYLDRASGLMPTFYIKDDCMDPDTFFYDKR
ncbi:Argonaute siRNA chaperone complex subunit Arb1-domain-containing protein [Fennellomyces sp. T-0311]|nr:Argonaute siRNA chaperone complex subunit Arb1-domain-containing protein [Fennellomyces sp. T-0311]